MLEVFRVCSSPPAPPGHSPRGCRHTGVGCRCAQVRFLAPLPSRVGGRRIGAGSHRRPEVRRVGAAVDAAVSPGVVAKAARGGRGAAPLAGGPGLLHGHRPGHRPAPRGRLERWSAHCGMDRRGALPDGEAWRSRQCRRRPGCGRRGRGGRGGRGPVDRGGDRGPRQSRTDRSGASIRADAAMTVSGEARPAAAVAAKVLAAVAAQAPQRRRLLPSRHGQSRGQIGRSWLPLPRCW